MIRYQLICGRGHDFDAWFADSAAFDAQRDGGLLGCPHCGGESHIFGHGGAEADARRLGVPFLGAVPLHMAIRETSDAGRPVVVSDPDGVHASAYVRIALNIAARLFPEADED